MRLVAVAKARMRLEVASEAIRALEVAEGHEVFGKAWMTFLLAANGVHSSLEQGAKSNPQSRQWFGQKKNERRRDPLLQYLHQARNADEHGLEPIIEHVGGRVKIGDGIHGGGVRRVSFDSQGYATVVKDPTYPNTHIEVVQPHPILSTVYDARYGNRYAPPREHLNQPLRDLSPIGLAVLSVEYISGLIQEAEKLPPDP